ncbi:glycosyl hydrolase 115 family protein [Abyssalbus ytuae]|uniref:Glycosyl hydrolase 115 family protein n=1 Tax=Abyssalbus ytuae TaxID=2926907 RepID=A0A9E7CY07_9FLAO|nr:glycosyl hydrolase 115 family protein [Abyssalbus ytuae]UOB16135.1 glycosyl hydrolase 115 family protein [Abyssalbus ytuae]
MYTTVKKLKSIIFIILSCCLLSGFTYAIDKDKYVYNKASKGSFPLATQGKVAPLLVSSNDYEGVLKVIAHLQTDIENVTGIRPQLFNDYLSSSEVAIIIGTVGKSELIDKLALAGKIDKSLLEGKWEKFITQVVNNPLPGIEQALVIAGSDKRGTIYGMYDLSYQIGVSPWYWWADVPGKKQSELYVAKGTHTKGEPKVKYRGIFINDEAPALSGWAYEKFGGFNAKFYEHVFELILRLKGNYLWPAMWGRMFYVDDPQNPVLANEYGIVIGTSHHEPLMRAHAEWQHFGKGEWDYTKNAATLENFWKEGMKRMGENESMVSIGMRGDGDEPMTEGTAIQLLEEIVKKQREIITDVTGKPAAETPQMWALYKEVQDYYDKGMRVPEDVTLLLCDDNWGNIRKLPELKAPARKGGYGIYYHFDYVGGPRNYKWLNTNQIERTWEQMHLAYEYGVKQAWIVNVGDIKPMEFPIEFFLDYAWNPEAWDAHSLNDYYNQWANDTFGEEYAKEIADILKKYTQYNARRKPELLDPSTYSLVDYNEAERVVEEYNLLVEKARKVYGEIPGTYKDAYYQLVLFPVQACANLNELYVTAARNKLYAGQGRILTNKMAQKVKQLFEKDMELTEYFHTKLANGKWNHMMSQTHIGYTYWQQPRVNKMPATFTIDPADDAEIGVAIDGSEEWWSGNNNDAALPVLDVYNNQSSYIEIFNRGKKPFNYKITPKDKWIKTSLGQGTIREQAKVLINIDWEKAPKGYSASSIIIEGAGKEIPVTIKTHKPNKENIQGFIESNGFIAIEAEHFSNSIARLPFKWIKIPNLGKTLSGVTAMPAFVPTQQIRENSPRLEYNVHLFTAGSVKVHAYFSPTINYTVREGLKYGIGFDDEQPQIIYVHADNSDSNWNTSVADNIKILTSQHEVKSGSHVLKFYMADSGLVLQKLVIETGALKKTYLGPPESVYVKH